MVISNRQDEGKRGAFSRLDRKTAAMDVSPLNPRESPELPCLGLVLRHFYAGFSAPDLRCCGREVFFALRSRQQLFRLGQ